MGGEVNLIDGYKAFRQGTFANNAALYRGLGAADQAPKTMVISCCDSRVEPVAIFNARPGDLFIVRNVANLVPPFDPLGNHHGTSAAVEFAVTGLEVETILVLGHAGCGGIHAYLQGEIGHASSNVFISKWMSIMDHAVAELPAHDPTAPTGERQTALEHAAVIGSLKNLAGFPFVAERLATSSLALEGAHFDIASGDLLWYDRAERRFQPVA